MASCHRDEQKHTYSVIMDELDEPNTKEESGKIDSIHVSSLTSLKNKLNL